MTENGNTEIKKTIFTTDKEAQYDERAKQILGQKQILAYILANTVEEFCGMEAEEIIPYIEGEPYVGRVPVDPGVTNAVSKKDGERIYGFNTEMSEINEGTIEYDILFYVRTKNGLSKIIVDIEAQKDEPAGYDILNRAVFYTSREISSQKNREFFRSEYNEIKQVYSIWICMNQKENTSAWYHLTKEELEGRKEWKGRTDLINIIMIGLSKTLPEQGEGKTLHRLLGTLFSRQLEAEEKIQIMEKEYKITVEEKMREEVWEMCNLSQGIKEEGIELGRSEERENTERERCNAERERRNAEKERHNAERERHNAEKEKRRADELERKNIWLMEQLAAHGISV